ncbi:MAG: hypothetical protein KatS3mg027_1933 [Bacteroidia bacterium]|nr:MAG: hypothetical protein KatS3mg027_1933 [Bacteroidia bacterium]
MIREKIKWADPLTITVVFVLIGLLMIVLFKKIKLGVLFFLISGIYGSFEFIFKKNYVLLLENKYPGKAIFKSEDSCDALPIKNLPQKIDGIKTDAMPKNIAIKVHEGLNVYIDKDGWVKPYSPIGWFFIKKVKYKSLDNCWDKLFIDF